MKPLRLFHRRPRPFLEIAALSVWCLARASAETLFFSNYNNPVLNPTTGFVPLSAVSQRFATEFFTLAAPATVRGAALLIWNTDTVEHDLDAWLYAADRANSGPGTLLTAFTGADDLLSAGETNLATFSHAGFTLNANTRYWLVAGLAEPSAQSAVNWLGTGSNQADFFGMFTVSSTPTTLLQRSTDGGATFATFSGLNAKFGLSDTAPSVNRVWDSGGASDLWSDGANWSANTAPTNGDSLTFGSGARTTNYADDAALSVNDLTFTNTAAAFTIHVPESSGSTQLTINGALTNSGILNQTLVADGATAAGMNGGVLTINSATMSGPITLIARGATGDGPNGGVIQFFGAADGTTTRVITEPGSYFEFGGRTGSLRLGSIEGGGQVLMGSNPLFVGYNNLDAEFSGTLAGGVGTRLEKHGTGRLILSESNTYRNGTTVFGGILEVRAPAYGLGFGDVSILGGGEVVYSQSAVGDFQTFTARRAEVAGQAGGLLRFTDTASAGRITMVVEGAVQGLNAGVVVFDGFSSAGTSTAIFVSPGMALNSLGGEVTLRGNAIATGATITNLGGTISGARGGLTTFRDSATAGAANIINEGGPANFGGSALFLDTSSAGESNIINQGVAGIGSGPLFLLRKGRTVFAGTSTAGAATITNLASPAAIGLGGATYFTENAIAGPAQMINEGSASGGSGYVEFDGTASAATATITNRGALGLSGQGGSVRFWDDATAGSATLIARSGLVANAPGGAIYFEARANGGIASATVEAGAIFDISRLTTPGTSIGAIEGAGTFFLGAKELTVGGKNANTTVTGTITDGGQSGGTGGSLTKVGTGALTLAGLNLYTGTTTVREGTLNIDSPLPNADIDVLGGVLNVSGDVTGSAIDVTPATGSAVTNFYASQRLESLTIGDGGLVVLAENAAPASFASDFALAAHAVPEPGIGALLASALGFLGMRRGGIRGTRAAYPFTISTP